MKTCYIKYSVILVFFIFFLNPGCVFGQESFDRMDIHFFRKKEQNLGVTFSGNNEREELRTDESREYEELMSGTGKLFYQNRSWNYLDFKQEHYSINFEAGPVLGYGNWLDSSLVENITADHKIFGFRTEGALEYLSRYYYSPKSYTLVELNGNARYDLFRQKSNGIAIDSNGVSTGFDELAKKSKFRFGFLAKAGWGVGRLNPVNHFMVADYLLNKYYKGRTFSYEEITALAGKIEEIKGARQLSTGHDTEKEAEQIQQYVNRKMLLTIPENLKADWIYGEFLPRYAGNRVEFGPFFRYYNLEPDFIYGGYFLYEHARYCNVKWNRNFKTGVNYNRYKRDDWVLGEVNLGWSYFVQLRNQFDFGVKYIPGLRLNNFGDVGKLNHGFIPYIGYFTQLDSSSRISFAFSLRISENESLMLPGPEFKLSYYHSSY